MLTYPNIDPIAIQIGSFGVHWYGLMYLAAFFTGWGLARWRADQPLWKQQGWSRAQIDDLLTWTMLGVVVGGRVGYVLFYDLKAFLDEPLVVFRIWNGGMSFHGGLLGVLVALLYWSRRTKRTFLEVVDFVAPLVPPGLFFGRIGNFINSELWGDVTTHSWGMVFPNGGSLPRHPSQLYEATLEGVMLFGLLWVYSSKPRAVGRISGVFAIFYAIFRFAVEFVRQPDVQLGYLAFGWLTMGQMLCLPLFVVGVWLLFRPASLPGAKTYRNPPLQKKNRAS